MNRYPLHSSTSSSSSISSTSRRGSSKLRLFILIAILVVVSVSLVLFFNFRKLDSRNRLLSSNSPLLKDSNKNNNRFNYYSSQLQQHQEIDDEADDEFLIKTVKCPSLPNFEALFKQEEAAEVKEVQEAENHHRAFRRKNNREDEFPPPAVQGECSASALCHLFLNQLKKRSQARTKKQSNNQQQQNRDNNYDGKGNRGNWWLPYSKGGRILHHDEDGFHVQDSNNARNNGINDDEYLSSEELRKNPERVVSEDDKENGNNNNNNKRIPKSKSELAIATLFASKNEGEAMTMMENMMNSNNNKDFDESDDFINKYISADYIEELKHDTVNSKEWWRRLYYQSFINKAMYALRRRVDLIVEGNAIVDWTRNSPAWSKLLVLNKWCDHYSWILWTDSDTFFMNHKIPFSVFLPRKMPTNKIRADRNYSLAAADENDSDDYIAISGTEFAKKSHADVLIAKDYRSWNTGVWFLRGDPGLDARGNKNDALLLQQRNYLKMKKLKNEGLDVSTGNNNRRRRQQQQQEKDNDDHDGDHRNNEKNMMNETNKHHHHLRRPRQVKKISRDYSSSEFFNKDVYEKDYFSKNFLHQLWEISDSEAMSRTGFHDQGSFLILTNTEKMNSNTMDPLRKVQIKQNSFHIFELEANMINSYPPPLLVANVDEKHWHKYIYSDGDSWIVHFPSCVKYVTCVGWLEALFSQAVCMNNKNGGDASIKEEDNAIRFPPPPSILARRNYSNIRIMQSSFRVLGKGLRL